MALIFRAMILTEAFETDFPVPLSAIFPDIVPFCAFTKEKKKRKNPSKEKNLFID